MSFSTRASSSLGFPVGRRTVLKAGLAAGAMQFASPFIVQALGEEPIKIGLDDPFTGTYAELGKHEQIGCQFAVDDINKKGGILGRPVPSFRRIPPLPTPALRCRRATC